MILTARAQPNVAEQLIKSLAEPQPGTQASIKPSAKALTQRKDRRHGKDELLDQATKEQVVVEVEQPAVHVGQLGGDTVLLAQASVPAEGGLTAPTTSGTAGVASTGATVGSSSAAVLGSSALSGIGLGGMALGGVALAVAASGGGGSSPNIPKDTEAPTISLANTAAGEVVNQAESTDAAGVTQVTAENGATWMVTFTSIDGTVTKSGTGTGSAQVVTLEPDDITTLGQGAVDVSVTATDAAGNSATLSEGGSFSLDTQILIDLQLVVDDVVDRNDLVVGNRQVASVNAESGVSWTVILTGTEGRVTKTGTGTGSEQAVHLTAEDLITLGQGEVTLVASAIDQANNIAQTTETNFLLSTEPPPSLALVAAPLVITNLVAQATPGSSDAPLAGWSETFTDNAALTVDGVAMSVRKVTDGGEGGVAVYSEAVGNIYSRTFTGSVWLWGHGQVTIGLGDMNGAAQQSSRVIDLTEEPTRYSFTETFNDWWLSPDGVASSGVTHSFMQILLQSVDGADEVFFSGVQIEEGAAMSAYISGKNSSVLTDGVISSREFSNGFSLTVDLTGITVNEGHEVQIFDQHGNVWADATLSADQGTNLQVLVKQRTDNVMADGEYQLFTRIRDNVTGLVSVPSTASLSVTLDTSGAEVIGSFAGSDEVIRGGTGNDTIHLTKGGHDTLVYDANPFGNGQDTIIGFDFETATGRDAILLKDLLIGYQATGDTQTDAQALANYIDLVQNGSNLELRVDQDGMGAGLTSILVATFVGHSLSSIGGATTKSQALAYMLSNSILSVEGDPIGLSLGNFAFINDAEDENDVVYTIIGLDGDVIVNGEVIATLSDSSDPGLVIYGVVNASDGTATFRSEDIKTLAQGPLTLTVTAIDEAGISKVVSNGTIRYDSSIVSAQELVIGVTLSIDLTGVSLLSGDTIRILDSHGQVVGNITNPASGIINFIVRNNSRYFTPDGLNELYVKVIDELGNSSEIDRLSMFVDTSGAEVIMGSNVGNDVFRGGGGNDTINLASVSHDSLVYNVQIGLDFNETGGNGVDQVTGFDFVSVSDKDTIIFENFLKNYNHTGNAQTDAQTLLNYINLVEKDGNLELRVDRDGSGQAYDESLLLTFMDATLASVNNSTNQEQALEHMLMNSSLIIGDAPKKTPIYYLAGQSNAERMQYPEELQDSFKHRVFDYNPGAITGEKTLGGTYLAADFNKVDWYPVEDNDPNTGELFDEMILDIRNLLSNNDAYLAGVLWIQGENDTLQDQTADDYENNLTQFISTLNENFGTDYEFSMVALSNTYSFNRWSTVRNAQFSMEGKFDNVSVIDPDLAFNSKVGHENQLFFSDELHYTPFAKAAILDRFFQIQTLEMVL